MPHLRHAYGTEQKLLQVCELREHERMRVDRRLAKTRLMSEIHDFGRRSKPFSDSTTKMLIYLFSAN